MSSPYIVTIDDPKNSDGTRDLSDHYPIVISNTNLTIISYNLQLLHTFLIKIQAKTTYDELHEITQEFAKYFANKGADVCCLQELFDNTANSLIQQAMEHYGYAATNRLGDTFISQLNGGIRTFIKKDLAKQLDTGAYEFKEKIDYFINGDASARKGITRTSFTAGSIRYHIFNTHMQAYYLQRAHYTEIALAQCVELKRFN